MMKSCRRATLLLGFLVMSCGAQGDEFLPKLNLDLRETTVSGISSGAFMAVQMGVAHSAEIKGVAATAGGPYFCAGEASWRGAAVDKVIARCMQGDPAFPARPITDDDHEVMREATDRWSAQGLIDATDNLARQKVWIFHGYNDGVVKRPVSDALQTYYRAFTPARQIFYKHELPAAHAQISASCVAGKTASQCNACATTGGNFINACAVGKTVYDAAGSALQFFYGPLTRAASSALKGEILAFDQSYYTLREGEEIDPARISMAETGYLYVPKSCGRGEPCRLHIAFHGCQQYAEKIGMDFVKGAGLNEWAEKNHIVVLYPQATSAIFPPVTPLNPNGCWDWWGYNDTGDQMTGYYATQQGLQIAAVWRMAQFMAMREEGGDEEEDDGEESNIVGVDAPVAVITDEATDVGETVAPVAALPSAPPRLKAAPVVKALDVSSDQIALIWRPVENAVAYRVYRLGKTPQEEDTLISPEGFVDTAFVDSGLEASSAYRYKVVAVGGAGDERAASKATVVKTAPQEPACDPYFSMAQGRPVDRDNAPTDAVCK
jgi:poly(3-hydroxybutyrate) depolymerase